MKDFDRNFRKIEWLGCVLIIFWATLYLALTGFGIWVVVMLLRFFGIV